MCIRDRGVEYEHTRPIKNILFYPGVFPTDVRHNVKIQREKLAIWAARHLPEYLLPQQAVSAAEAPVSGSRRPLLPPWLRNVWALLGIAVGVALSVLFFGRRFRKRE